jgi:hypothetical protein
MTKAVPGGGPQGRVGKGKNRRRLLPDLSPIIAATITGLLGLVGVVLILVYGGNHGAQGSGGGSTVPPTRQAGQAPSRSARLRVSGRTVIEYTDWRGGVQVYADNAGGASGLPPIPFDHVVQVSCIARNLSGMASINGFYLVASGRWKGTYASANEFTNGGPRQVASDPNIDPRVPTCQLSGNSENG